MTDDLIIDVACCIRPYLPELVGPAAPDLDHDLAKLLHRAAEGEHVDGAIIERLQEHPATLDWTAGFLTHRRPPDLAAVIEKGLESNHGFQTLPGHGEPVRASRYRCPRGDYVWFRRAVGQSVPNCPTHNLLLEPAGTP